MRASLAGKQAAGMGRLQAVLRKLQTINICACSIATFSAFFADRKSAGLHMRVHTTILAAAHQSSC